MNLKTAQAIYNRKLNQETQTWSGRLKVRLINIIFNQIKKTNPLVEAFVGQFKLHIPFSHELPFIIKSSPYYSTNLARIAEQVNRKYSDLKFIDIGANIGDSVALLRSKATFPILCIEGDPYFFSILHKNATNFADVYLSKTYVGETAGELKAKSVEVGGTAHLSQAGLEADTIHIKKLSSILAGNPIFKLSKMLKIDTDGFDNKILRGSIDFIEAAKPVVFFEYDPFFLAQQNDDGISIFDTLATNGYQNILIYENYGELMLSADLKDKRLLEDINYFFTGRKGLMYCDICAFHKEDNDLFNKIRESEINFFSQARI
ncbi:FkbM family methyltransferase [Spirosoma endbachense]|uniref:FkbM family methyltransferase n=1 Tax=Spirosoma endbachense TaxID=2666025 RepID=A0A6P1W906_9BACT|nr:FkbM family methyltransferase [Spirosoma endbachense]QHW00500.1 FkbM family methyltransferase [Spirosoma endbachense]